MDKSFEGLLFSLAIHAILLWIYIYMPAPPPVGWHAPTEVTYIDPPDKKTSKAGHIIEQLNKHPKEIKDLADTADFLSQFTDRVKKQIRAREIGPTRNAQPSPIRTETQGQNEGNRPGAVGLDEPEHREEKRGDIGMPLPGGNQALRQVAIGPSSIGEFIPGVEEGDFTALNTDQFTYYAFFARINEQVRNRWVAGIRGYMSRLSQKDLEELAKMDRVTVFEIIVTRTGEFSSSVISHTSGDQILDRTSVESVKASAPFINPPQGMIEDDGFIHLHYAFTLRLRPPIGQAGS